MAYSGLSCKCRHSAGWRPVFHVWIHAHFSQFVNKWTDCCLSNLPIASSAFYVDIARYTRDGIFMGYHMELSLFNQDISIFVNITILFCCGCGHSSAHTLSFVSFGNRVSRTNIKCWITENMIARKEIFTERKERYMYYPQCSLIILKLLQYSL